VRSSRKEDTGAPPTNCCCRPSSVTASPPASKEGLRAHSCSRVAAPLALAAARSSACAASPVDTQSQLLVRLPSQVLPRRSNTTGSFKLKL